MEYKWFQITEDKMLGFSLIDRNGKWAGSNTSEEKCIDIAERIIKASTEIKLLNIGELGDGTKRFQSQLYAGKDTADFVMSPDGIMKCYGMGNKGFDFYEYYYPYKIVSSKEDMKIQII